MLGLLQCECAAEYSPTRQFNCVHFLNIAVGAVRDDAMPRHLTRGFCMHFVNNNYRVFATGQQYSQEDANRSRNASYLKCTLSLIPPPARLAATAPLHCTRPGTRALCVTRTGAGAPAGRPTSLKHFGMPPCSSISEGASSTGASWSSRSAGHTSVPQAMRVYGLNSPGTPVRLLVPSG